ncbi:hypothetical protein VFPFJ_03441 [Purpureocillium lilacinum]|uniref:Uncharacterized protein n=1 Tax=Purpureocillium lilacinum TaxID=33203 RepID=A0A179HQ80_PURLI|nr:hypothetical protein VFPFJ_03441 [Purpureocillium lilacinum]OAQ91701.1 hypothetical protein VFPFJ_03441 [Purpureocillium lilacinum]
MFAPHTAARDTIQHIAAQRNPSALEWVPLIRPDRPWSAISAARTEDVVTVRGHVTKFYSYCSLTPPSDGLLPHALTAVVTGDCH